MGQQVERRVPMSAPHRISFFSDVFKGAVYGDGARELGIAGTLTQALFGYIPVIGTMCALRDLVVDLNRHDRFGALMNFLAVFPILGGFPKTLRAISLMRNLVEGRRVFISHRERMAQRRE